MMDELPELAESYSVQLMDPSLGRLAVDRTTVEVAILPNQDPYGLFEVVPLGDPASASISVEEGSGVLGFEVRRAFGTFGSTSVQWRTTAETATDNTGVWQWYEGYRRGGWVMCGVSARKDRCKMDTVCVYSAEVMYVCVYIRTYICSIYTNLSQSCIVHSIHSWAS